jgi:hypothetical protein
MLTYVVIIVAVAFIFDFINGFHDSANSIATVVGTRVLSPLTAVVWAAFFNLAAAFTVGTAVAKTVGSGMIDGNIVTPSVILGALLGAIIWNLITWVYGLPSSSSHALIGGYAGSAVAKAGFGAIIASGWTKTLIFIVLSPLIGFILGFGIMVAVFWLFKRVAPARVDRVFRAAQLASSAFFSLSHGANDAQKTMGIIVGLLVSSNHLFVNETGWMHAMYVPTADTIPFWVDRCLFMHQLRHTVRGLAHRPHDGLPHHAASAGRRVCGRDWRRAQHLHRYPLWHPGQHHSHDNGLHCRRRRHPASVRRPVGRGRPDCLGMATHDSRRGPHVRSCLYGATLFRCSLGHVRATVGLLAPLCLTPRTTTG